MAAFNDIAASVAAGFEGRDSRAPASSDCTAESGGLLVAAGASALELESALTGACAFDSALASIESLTAASGIGRSPAAFFASVPAAFFPAVPAAADSFDGAGSARRPRRRVTWNVATPARSRRTTLKNARRMAAPWRLLAIERLGLARPMPMGGGAYRGATPKKNALQGRALLTTFAVQRGAVNPWFTWEPRRGSSRARLAPIEVLSVQRLRRSITHDVESTGRIRRATERIKDARR